MFFDGQLMSTLGERIKSERLAKKLNQEELGKAVGVSKSSVCQWEKGLTKNMDGVNLVKSAIALGVNPIWLALGKGEKTLFSSDPMQRDVIAIMQGVKDAIAESEVDLSDEELRRVYRRVIDHYFDSPDVSRQKIDAILKLSLL